VDYFPANRKDWVMERLIASLKLRAEALGIENTAFETKNSVQEKAEQEAKEKLVAARKAALEKEKREVQRRKQREFITANFRWLGIGGIILFVLICGGFGLNYFIKNLPVPTATPVILPSAILKPVTPTPDDMVMVYVPEGTFTMGDDSNPPIHAVYLDAFWIDQTEVTNKQYKACVDAGTCEPPSDTSSNTRPNYYGNLEFDNYPVLYVNWDKANRYCEVWKKGDLPTEAQWEKAARGTDGRTYPWGNEAPSSDLLNYYQNVNDTTKVKNYPNTKSFYGTYDMAGNVWEWVNDWYGATYYKDTASSNNPLGPEAGQQRVLRGGSWYYLDFNVRSAIRNWVDPSISNYYVGFRCARSLP
jgi:serine/threonine-protein kinase